MDLLECCRSGNVEGLKKIFTHHKLSDFSKRFDSSELLCKALSCYQIEVAKLLLQNEANVNVQGNRPDTPLHYAVNMKNTEILQILLDKKADITAANYAGETALHLALKNNNLDIVNLLIDKGAFDDVNNETYYMFLDIAVKNKNYKILQLLLENISDPECTAVGKDVNVKVDFATLKEKEKPNRKQVVKCKTDLICKEDFENKEEKSSSFKNTSKLNIKDIIELDKINIKINFEGLLHKAVTNVRMGNEEKVKNVVQVLLTNNFDVNATDRFGRTPLYHTCYFDHLELCKCLVANGSNMKVDQNRNILHMSAENTNERFIKFLLEEGADVNARTNDGSTALHIVCKEGSERCVELLLQHHADVNLKNNEGLTPLHVAAQQYCKNIVDMILRSGSIVNATTIENKTALHFAARYTNKDIVQSLIEFGADVKAKDNNFQTALCYAADFGRTEIIRFLLDRNPDLQDESNKLAFCLAILKESKNSAEPFLSHGFTIQTEDFNNLPVPEPLYIKYLQKYDSLEYKPIFKDVLKREISINGCFEYQVLCSSIRQGFLKVVKDLLNPNADVNTVLENGFNLLHIAVMSCRYSVAVELLERGANINCVFEGGHTLMHFTICKSIKENMYYTLPFLLKHGHHINPCNDRGDTPLHLAASFRDFTYVELLLENGADVNSRNLHNSTPLHMAIEEDDEDEFPHYYDVVKLLLQYDADVNIRNVENETPLDLTISSYKTWLVILLLNHRAVYYSCEKFRPESNSIFNIQKIHTIKLQAINDPNTVTVCGKHNDFSLTCCAEIKKMIQCQIGSNVSMYDLLTKKDLEVESYMKNEQIVCFLGQCDLENSYPIYSSFLQVRIDKANRRNELRRLGNCFLERELQLKLPSLVIEKICSFFSNSDLRRLTFIPKVEHYY